MAQIDPQLHREFALEVVQRLRAAGYQGLWAGGCVRDQLLGQTPKDYDVATDATPDQVRQLFGHRRTLAIGAAFGVIAVLASNKLAGQIEVVTFREDTTYSDGRRPDQVRFSSPQMDAQRRDFTMNGLFYEPVAQQIIDYVNGQADIASRIVRAIGDPAQRFTEDKLRLLRAVRFATTYGFALESATEQAVRDMADQLHAVSIERITMELRRMLEHPRRTAAVNLLADVGLLPQILPELGESDIAASSAPLSHLPAAAKLPLSLATLLCEVVNSGTAREIATRLKLPNKEVDRIGWLVAHRTALGNARQQPWPTLQPLLVHEGAADLLDLHAALHADADDDLAYCREKLALPPEILNPPPLITGSDLQKMRIPPGPIYQELLQQVRTAQLAGEINTTDEALQLAQVLFRSV
jgi:tRNA nucleotidyltransferase/poly(A) polymerase